MDKAFRMGLMHGQFDSMTQGERMELRVRRMVEWRRWWNKVLGRSFPMRKERYRLRWPDVPDAEKERYCGGWGCTKKVPAGRLVCPWCGRMEQADDFSWMDVLAMPKETVDMGNGICKTVFRPTGRDGGTVLEQYTRMSEEALELKTELVTEVPVETVRAWLEELGGGGRFMNRPYGVPSPPFGHLEVNCPKGARETTLGCSQGGEARGRNAGDGVPYGPGGPGTARRPSPT